MLRCAIISLSILKAIQTDAKSEGRSGESEFNKPQGREIILGLGRNTQQRTADMDCQQETWHQNRDIQGEGPEHETQITKRTAKTGLQLFSSDPIMQEQGPPRIHRAAN